MSCVLVENVNVFVGFCYMTALRFQIRFFYEKNMNRVSMLGFQALLHGSTMNQSHSTGSALRIKTMTVRRIVIAIPTETSLHNIYILYSFNSILNSIVNCFCCFYYFKLTITLYSKVYSSLNLKLAIPD